jgi:hypothetical protein
MLRFIRKFIYLYVVLILVLAFQNCGQVQISLAPTEELSSLATLSMMAEGCVNSKQIQSEKTKFVFVVDLSRSNIGEFYKAANNNFYFDSNLGSDPTAKRYKVIKDFIKTCGNSTNNDYSLIAFSKTAGEMVVNGTGKVLQCKNQFVNSAQMISQIETLENLQTEEADFFNQFSLANNFPYKTQHASELALKLHGETNYVAATDCLASTIETNLIQPTDDSSNYQIFFMSDGEAKSSTLDCDTKPEAEKIQCYITKMDAKLNYLMKLSAAKSKPIRIHSLYYTANGSQNLKIETYMKYLSSIGQTSEPINLGTFNSSASGTTTVNPFCELLAVDKSIVYRTSKIYAANTNYIKIGANFKTDSDADGIIDELEDSYGSDKYNPRSLANGVLDGVCKIIGTKSQCQARKQQITCNAADVNKFNLSDCDIKMLSLAQSAVQPELAGVDTDNDGLPDYIEILKGLSPINNDSFIDYDIDGLNNLQEVSMGLDPFTPDKKEDALILSNSVFKDQINQCTSGGWNIELSKIGGIENSPNNLMFFFRVESKNTPGLFEYRVHNTTYNLERQEDTSLKASFNDLFIDVSQFETVVP